MWTRDKLISNINAFNRKYKDLDADYGSDVAMFRKEDVYVEILKHLGRQGANPW